MTESEMIAWIDSASLEQLLRRWRFAPIGDQFFVGVVGEHFSDTIAERRKTEGNSAWTAASKSVGWSE
jgi:hypothetical protein